ncbi:MAG: T9SS type A sorting domain-containing protein [Flavobacteriaceae bacterium]|nr:T9SS type A sorting domain-containing protein [Flavobacteriaceae bacterium]
MKKTILFLFLSCFAAAGIVAQANWVQIPEVPSGIGRYDDVFFLNENLGWAANGDNATAYKTTDGGQTWNSQFESIGYFRNIEFLDENIGFIGTLDGVFLKTTDGGDNWENVALAPNPPAICGLDAVGNSTVYGCGAWFEPAYIIKSSDSGETWEFIDMSAYAVALVEILFIDEQTGFVSGRATDGGVILKTTDGGSTWTEIFNSGGSSEYVWKMQLMENNTVMFGSIQSNTQGKITKSLDSGETWEMFNVPIDFIQAIGFQNTDRGWIGGTELGIHQTNDGGETWVDTGSGTNLNRIFFVNEELAFASGDGIYKFDGTLGLSDIATETPSGLQVTIAPMPIKDRLNLDIEFTNVDNLVIELYDINGKFLTKFARDRIMNPQTKRYSFDFNYPKGTYLLDVHTNNHRKAIIITKE